jgi:peptidoglycan/LPS O-acetylase OafA/YrhL
LFGLDLFFVLSGFLITTILDTTRDSEKPFFTFYARRVLRIVPLYFAYLTIIPIVFSRAGPIAIGTASERIWDWTFLTNVAMTHKSPLELGFLFGHLWSLAIEEQFYVMWPLVVLLTPRRELAKVCVVLMGFSVLLRVYLSTVGLAHYGWLLMPSRLDGLMGGSLVAILAAEHPERLRNSARAIITALTALIILYVTSMLVLLWPSKVDLLHTFYIQLPARRVEIALWPFLSAIFFSSIVALAVTQENRAPRWLSARWLRSTGRYSYGMYLFHSVILFLFYLAHLPLRHPIGGFDFPYQLVWIVLLILVSRTTGAITWNAFEKQFLKLAPAYRFPSSGMRNDG